MSEAQRVFTEAVVERLRTVLCESMRDIPNATADVWAESDFLRRVEYLIFEARRRLLAMPSERIDIDRSWPADWWQAVRARWLPAWWLRRHPVRMESVSVHREIYERVCPHVEIPVERARHIEWLIIPSQPEVSPCGD